jgi:hypothetical protein
LKFDWTKTGNLSSASKKSKDSDSSIDEEDLDVDEHSYKPLLNVKPI